MYPEFQPLTTTAGLEIIDPIETRRFTLQTTTKVSPIPAGTDGFVFPIDTACEIQAERITLAYTVPVTVRARDGTFQDTLKPSASRAFPDGEYLVELDAPIKTYLKVDSSFTVDIDTDNVTFDFGSETTVTVGVRSFHSSPAHTITVPDDPRAMMKAVSVFSSALKTTSPERSWPTLRGHPPRIERGDELVIPDELEAPDTNISIEVPPEYGLIYAVAPLAYYLGADVVPGDEPRVTADAGVSYYLGDDATEVSETAGEILQRTLLLDCVTRTEGYYSLELHERNLLESQVDLDFAGLYDASPSERLAAYLSVSDEAIAPITSSWHQVTHVEPVPESAEVLPYIVNDLSAVRIESSEETAWTDTESHREVEDAVGSFLRCTRSPSEDKRNSELGETENGELDGTENSNLDGTENSDLDGTERGIPGVGEYVPLPEVDALEQAYLGDKTPERGAKLLASAFENDAPEPTEGVIEITVVCNDEEMRAEWDTVSEIYGDRDDLHVNVECKFGVSTDELRAMLAEDHDVFHFIGHIDGLGFECPDGILGAESVEETGATTVLLNGCRSYDQGIELIEAGANAAIVSLGDVENEGAVEVGETLSRLFRHGFSVGSAMDIVEEYTSIGQDYLVVGDPNTEVAQCETGMPVVYHITESSGEDVDTDSGVEGESGAVGGTGVEGESGDDDGTGDNGSSADDALTVEALMYPTKIHGIGSLYHLYFGDSEVQYLALGFCPAVTVDRDKLYDFFSNRVQPLVLDGDFVWSDVWPENT